MKTSAKKHPVIADFYTEEQKDAFQQRFVWYIAGGVGAILFGMALLLMSEELLGRYTPWDAWSQGIFLLIVAGAVWAFTYGGIQRDTYNVARYNWKNDPGPEAQRRQALTGAVCGVLMPLAAAVYVGLALELWRTAWWVFAVAGILCGVAALLLNPYHKEKG